jgi:hypothetical protein
VRRVAVEKCGTDYMISHLPECLSSLPSFPDVGYSFLDIISGLIGPSHNIEERLGSCLEKGTKPLRRLFARAGQFLTGVF